jgi:hypothetical protein
MNQPRIPRPQISQMNADGENPRDDPLLVRLADSAIQICCVTADPAIQSLMKTRGWPDFAKANPAS